MGQFIDNNLANYKDQEANLQKVAVQFSHMLPNHLDDPAYLQAANEILDAQDAVMILLDAQGQRLSTMPEYPEARSGEEWKQLDVSEVFSPGELSKVLQGGTASTTFFYGDKAGKQRFHAVAVPLFAEGRTIGVSVMFQEQFPLENTQQYFKRLFAYAIIIGFLLTTFFAFFLSTKITQPLLQMKQAADLITQGNYRFRVPVRSGDEIGALATSFNHMTERLDASVEALNREKEHLASVLRGMTDAVIAFDAEGRLMLSNPPGERILREWSHIQWDGTTGSGGAGHPNGPQPQESDGYAPPAGREPREMPEPLRHLFEDVIHGRKELTSNLHVQNGVWSVVIAPLFTEDMRVRGAVAVFRDVTEEYRLDKLRKDFVANVSHELRTPLSMLQGYSEALLDDIAATPEERQELVQVIHDESLRMVRLVSDLLDLTRMETGHMEMSFREVNLRVLLTRVHRKFSTLCKERDIQLELACPEEPLKLSRADEDRLEQVLTNLLDNAVRHTSAGRKIEIRASETARNGQPHVLLQISDQGRGIPREDLPFIFERFYKADKARTRGANGGTGLGLSIVKNIVEAHRGTVAVDSALGEGTTFSIELPV